MSERAFRRRELNHSERERSHGRKGMDLHHRGSVQEWRKRHGMSPAWGDRRACVKGSPAGDRGTFGDASSAAQQWAHSASMTRERCCLSPEIVRGVHHALHLSLFFFQAVTEIAVLPHGLMPVTLPQTVTPVPGGIHGLASNNA